MRTELKKLSRSQAKKGRIKNEMTKKPRSRRTRELESEK